MFISSSSSSKERKKEEKDGERENGNDALRNQNGREKDATGILIGQNG